MKQEMELLKCSHCGNLTEKQHSNDGKKWLCVDCYIGFHCFPTPQTKWAELKPIQSDKNEIKNDQN